MFPDRLSTTRLRLPRQPAAANGATTPGFSVPFPSECVDAAHAGSRVPLSVSWQLPRSLSLRDASSGSESSPPGWFSGRRPFARSRHCTGQVATDPQSPKGGSQRACPTRGAHRTASGCLGTVALLKQTYPAWQFGRGLFGMPAREIRVNPPFNDRSLGRRPSVTLFQRGTACFRLGVFIDSGRW